MSALASYYNMCNSSHPFTDGGGCVGGGGGGVFGFF